MPNKFLCVLTLNDPTDGEAITYGDTVREVLEWVACGPRVCLSLGGGGLDLLSRNHTDLLFRMKQLVERHQLCILARPFYDGVSGLHPDEDVRAQLQMSIEYWESFLGQAPTVTDIFEGGLGAETLLMAENFQMNAVLFLSKNVSKTVLCRRGRVQVPAFGLDQELGHTLGTSDAKTWFDGLDVRAQHGFAAARVSWDDALKTLAVRHDWTTEANQRIEWVLPQDALRDQSRAFPACWEFGATIDLQENFLADMGAQQWFNKVLWVSDKLREASLGADDEELNAEQEQALASLQRRLFALENASLMRGATEMLPWREILNIEKAIDTVSQGEEPYLLVEEDSDVQTRQDEVYISNSSVHAWLPLKEPAIRALEERGSGTRWLAWTDVRGQNPFLGAYFSTVPADAYPEPSLWQDALMGAKNFECRESEVLIDEEGLGRVSVKQVGQFSHISGEGTELSWSTQLRTDARGLSIDGRYKTAADQMLIFALPLAASADTIEIECDGHVLDLNSHEWLGFESLRVLDRERKAEIKIDRKEKGAWWFLPAEGGTSWLALAWPPSQQQNFSLEVGLS